MFAIAHLAHHLVTSLPEPLSPFIQDQFSLNVVQVGWMISAFNIAYGIGQLPSSWLAHRVGHRTLITVGICGVALIGFLIGLPLSYSTLIVLLVIMGLVGGGYHPSALPLISASVDPKIRGRALGLHQIGGSSSFFLVPLIGVAIAGAWNWRGSFISLAIPTMIIGIFLYIVLTRDKHAHLEDNMTQEAQDEPADSYATLKHLAVFIILSTFTHIVAHSVKALIPIFMVDTLSWSEGSAGAFLAIFYSTGVLTSLLGGYLSDRFGPVRVIVIISLIGGAAIYLLDIAPNAALIGVVTFVIGMVVHMRMVASSAYIVGKTAPHHRAWVFGIYFAIIQSNSSLTQVVGWLIDRWDYTTAFIVTAVATIAVTIICTLLLRVGRNKPRVAAIT